MEHPVGRLAVKLIERIARAEAARKPKCPDCNSVGLSHCSDPINCGGVYWPDEMYRKLEADNKALHERLEEQRAVNLRLIEDVKSMTGKIGSGREQMARLRKPEDIL